MLLSPAEFGIVGIVTVFIAFVNILAGRFIGSSVHLKSES